MPGEFGCPEATQDNNATLVDQATATEGAFLDFWAKVLTDVETGDVVELLDPKGWIRFTSKDEVDQYLQRGFTRVESPEPKA